MYSPASSLAILSQGRPVTSGAPSVKARARPSWRRRSRMSPLPRLLPCPDPAAPPVAAGGAVAAVVPPARQAGQVATAICCVRQVEVPPCYGERPPEHGLAAVGAYVAGPVQP